MRLYRNGVKMFDSSKYDFGNNSDINKFDTVENWVSCTCDEY